MVVNNNALTTSSPNTNTPLGELITMSLDGNTHMNFSDGKKEWLFKDYMKKFRPVNVLERLRRKKQKMGRNVSLEKDFDELFDAMDETDDLLSIKIRNKPTEGGRRKWFPPGTINTFPNGQDQMSYRHRLYDLMLHAIFRTRNKMVIMQDLRKKYKDNKLYKMGFMMSKTDMACKLFHKMAYFAIAACVAMYYKYVHRLYLIEVLQTEERLVYKWFDIELLIDLLKKNDESCKKMLKEHDEDRLMHWEFDE